MFLSMSMCGKIGTERGGFSHIGAFVISIAMGGSPSAGGSSRLRFRINESSQSYSTLLTLNFLSSMHCDAPS